MSTNAPTTVGIHPKVKAPAWVGVALTIATVIAHFVAGQHNVPWLTTYGAAAVTVLGFVAGYVTPSPVPKAVVTYVDKGADYVAATGKLVAELQGLLNPPAKQPVAETGEPAPDVSVAFPDPATLPPVTEQ